MNNSDKYQKYALCREMLETADVVRNFNVEKRETYGEAFKSASSVLLTGEGSSRIFPAKKSIYDAFKSGMKTPVYTEGATQAQEYALEGMTVFGASNSGKTKELIRLFNTLVKEGHQNLYGLTAYAGSTLENYCKATHVLSCGSEDAVAATKSVAEQALFFDDVRAAAEGRTLEGLKEAGDRVEEVLTQEIDPEIISRIANAGTIYFAGRNNGVAEELTLKTNEITRKKSDFLEGTYAAHGIEEVMNAEDVIIVIDPFEEEEEKFMECLAGGVGTALIAISSRKTSFPYNMTIPEAGAYQNYVELAAGWNLLVETGLALGIDLDKPRKGPESR